MKKWFPLLLLVGLLLITSVAYASNADWTYLGTTEGNVEYHMLTSEISRGNLYDLPNQFGKYHTDRSNFLVWIQADISVGVTAKDVILNKAGIDLTGARLVMEQVNFDILHREYIVEFIHVAFRDNRKPIDLRLGQGSPYTTISKDANPELFEAVRIIRERTGFSDDKYVDPDK
jgi:hypothetical protein